MSTSKKDAQRVKRKLADLDRNVEQMAEKMQQSEPQKIVYFSKGLIDLKFENNDTVLPDKKGNGGKGGSEQHLSKAFKIDYTSNKATITNTAEHADTLERGRTQSKYEIPESLDDSPIYIPASTRKDGVDDPELRALVNWQASQTQTKKGFNYLADAQDLWRQTFDPDGDLRDQIRGAGFNRRK